MGGLDKVCNIWDNECNMATEKQKRALDNIVENGGNVSKAMRDAGYTDATAKTPKKLTESKGYQALVDIYLPDDMLLRALAEDIEEKKQNRKPELELAFKVKGKLTDKHEVDIKNYVITEGDSEDKPMESTQESEATD